MPVIKPTKGYLRDTKTGEILEFQFNPQPLKDNEGQTINVIQSPSSSHPRVTPGAAGPRDISFSLSFARDSDNKSEVAQKASWLKSLRYPHEGGSFQTYRAPIVLFVFGKFYKIACYLKSVNMTFDTYFDPETLEPWFMKADLSFVEVPEQELVASAVRKRGAFNVVR